MSDPNARSKKWRRENPDKALKQRERATEARKERLAADAKLLEAVREKARESAAEQRRLKNLGAPKGWKIVVRLQGEKRGRAVIKIVETEEGRLRGISRTTSATPTPKAYRSQAAAEKEAQRLLDSFPSKVAAAYAQVIT